MTRNLILAVSLNKPFLTTLSSGLIICYNGFQNSGKYFTYDYEFIIEDGALECYQTQI